MQPTSLAPPVNPLVHPLAEAPAAVQESVSFLAPDLIEIRCGERLVYACLRCGVPSTYRGCEAHYARQHCALAHRRCPAPGAGLPEALPAPAVSPPFPLPRAAVPSAPVAAQPAALGPVRRAGPAPLATPQMSLLDEPEPASPAPTWTPSVYQQAIFEDVAHGVGNTAIRARAGCGKTSSLLEALRRSPPGRSTLFLAFNSSIARELRDRAPEGVDVSTCHALGQRVVRAAFGPKTPLEKDKLRSLIKRRRPEEGKIASEVRRALYKLVSFAKQTLARTPLEIRPLLRRCRLDPIDFCAVAVRDRDHAQEIRAVFCEEVFDILKASGDDTAAFDFDDQIWLPVWHDLPTPKWDLLLVDECVPGWTPVLLADGSSKSIEEIVDGNLAVEVLAYDTVTRQAKPCRVTGWFKIRNQKPLVEVRVKGSRHDRAPFVICTTDHRVWADGAWTPAGELKPGMALQLEPSSGSASDAAVVSVKPVSLPDPHVFDITVEECHNFYANGILVHNCQDLNRTQMELLPRLVNPGGRIVVVGDPRQAIYSFRGADEGAFETLRATLDAKILPLTVTFRCPKAVVREAQVMVPDIEARADAPEGQVSSVPELPLQDLRPGDFVLSRSNAPLVRAALRCLARRMPVVIQGRDITVKVRELLDSAAADGAPEAPALVDWLDGWLVKRKIWLEARDLGTAEVIDLHDAVTTLVRALGSSAKVRQVMEELSTSNEADAKDKIVFSSVHRAKGLERERVYMFRDTFLRKTHAPAGEAPSEEEENLYYVAVTRSAGTLVMVNKS